MFKTTIHEPVRMDIDLGRCLIKFYEVTNEINN